jgi:hypothetical protein
MRSPAGGGEFFGELLKALEVNETFLDAQLEILAQESPIDIHFVGVNHRIWFKAHGEILALPPTAALLCVCLERRSARSQASAHRTPNP